MIQATDRASEITLDPELESARPPLLHVDPAGAAGFVADHADDLRRLVHRHGAVLLRGLGIADATGLAGAAHALAAELLVEREGFAPRREVAPGVHTSSEWPAGQPMCLHHELSYTSRPPSLLLFGCLRPAASGGATPIADSAQVLQTLPIGLVDRLDRQGWILERVYGGDVGPSVEDGFGSNDRAAVERYCAEHAISCEWLPGGELRTRQHRRAVVAHPVTGVRCFFNQVGFLSEWTLEEEIREFLIETAGPDGLPFTTRFGDGEPIGPDVVETVNAAWADAEMREPWQAGDLLIVDNLRTGHGRDAFEGDREVLVVLADPVPGLTLTKADR